MFLAAILTHVIVLCAPYKAVLQVIMVSIHRVRGEITAHRLTPAIISWDPLESVPENIWHWREAVLLKLEGS